MTILRSRDRFGDAAVRLLRPLAAATLAFATPSCGDRATAGPGIASRASVAVAPTFQAPSVGGPLIRLDRVEGWLVPVPAADSVFAEATFTGESAALAFDVVVTGLEQRFVFRLGAFDAAGERIFASSDTIVVRPGENQPVDGVALAYVARDAAVTDFVVTGRTASLATGDTVHLSARACCSSGEALFPVNAGWVSRDPLVAVVGQGTGIVTGVAPGRAWIVATLYNGTQDSLKVDVADPIASVTIESPSPALGAIGDAATLAAVARDAAGASVAATILWRSLDPGVATVDPATGTVTGAANGTARIVAEAGGKADTVAVVVEQVAVSLEAVAERYTLNAIGHWTTLAAAARDANGYPLPSTTAIGFVAVTSLDGGRLTIGARESATSVRATAAAVGEGWAEAWLYADSSGAVRLADTVIIAVRQTPASVVISPSAYAMYPGQGVTLVAEVRDSAGVVIPAPVVEWATSDPAVATVDGAGMVTASAAGTAKVGARAGPAYDEATIDVLAAPPLTRTWLGGDAADPADWSNPGNWSPAGVPAAADTIVVPATPNAPVLRVEASVAEVTVAPGATLGVDSALIVTGSVSGQLAGAGTVHLVGDQATLAGDFPSLVITRAASAVGDVRVSGRLHVTTPAGRFSTKATGTAVAGALVVDDGATLLMDGGRLDVEGSATFAGANGPGTLTSGTLAVRGDFAAKGVAAFQPDAGFLVVLDGSKGAQRVTMDAPGPDGQRFAEVVVANATVEAVRFEGVHIAGSLKDDGARPGRMTFEGASQVDGGLSLLVTGGDVGGTGTLTVLGDLEAMSSSVGVGVLRLAGSRGTEMIGTLGTGHAWLELLGDMQPVRSGLAYRSVRVVGSARLVGPEAVTLEGALVIEGDAAQLVPSGVPLIVSGDLVTGLKGVLAMTNDADDVTVKGAVTIGGGATAPTFVYGTLRVGRDFTVACKVAECFQPGTNGNFTVRFDGVEQQTISLSMPGAPGDGNALQHFRNVRVANSSGVTFATGAPIVGGLLVDPEGVATIPEGIWVDVFGTLSIDRSGSTPGRIDNFGELYAGVDDTSGEVKPNPVLPRK
jgi:uncharacterized protein YjdB